MLEQQQQMKLQLTMDFRQLGNDILQIGKDLQTVNPTTSLAQA